MANDSLFRELCKPEVLKIGWHLAQLDSRDDFFSDPVGYADFASNLSDRLANVREEIRDKRYRPRHLVELDIPKSGLSVRPGNVLPIEEATILHGIVYLLAPKLDSRLFENVFSHRLHADWALRVKRGKGLFRDDERELPFLRGATIRRLSPFQPWYQAWPEFDRARIKAARDAGFSHLTRTDIAAYFENIDLRLLEVQLRDLVPNEGHLLQLLMRILESWTRVTSTGTPVGRGIPQGNDASSFLGNIYLLSLDRSLRRFCKQHDALWYRYVDDVEVYSRNYETARDVVFVINEALRSLYLNLQGSKTEILSGDKLAAVLSSSESVAVDSAWGKLEKIDCRATKNQRQVTEVLNSLRPITNRFRDGLPASAQGLEKRDSRILRRLMTIYGRCGRPWLREVAYAALLEPPDLRMLLKCLRYLVQMPYQEHRAIGHRLLTMVEAERLPIPYHSAMVLETLRSLHPTDAGRYLAARIRKFAFGRKRAWPVRQKALEAIATLPLRADHATSQALRLLRDEHPWVRRAACVLLARGEVQSVRDAVSRLLYAADPNLNRLALLWHRHIADRDFANREIDRIRKGSKTSFSVLLRLPALYLLRCNPDRNVVRRLRRELMRQRAIKSAKIGWHVRHLLKETEWAL